MHSAWKWMYFPIPVRYKFWTWRSLEPPSSTLGGDKHVRPQSFLWKIELWRTFTRNFLWFNLYFLQRSVLKWIYFPNRYIVIFRTSQHLELLAPLLGDIDICAHRVFHRKFNTQQLLFEAFLGIKRIFCNVQPLSESIFLF